VLSTDGLAGYVCSNCHAYPILSAISRFVDAESYADSFGYKWMIHRQTQVDSKSGRNDSQRALR
jgi:hypothetical protein